jgi:hypothetical protein
LLTAPRISVCTKEFSSPGLFFMNSPNMVTAEAPLLHATGAACGRHCTTNAEDSMAPTRSAMV